MSGRRPLIISFIGDLNTLGALVSIATLFPKFFQKLGIYIEPALPYSNSIIRVLITIFLLIISYGYLKLKIWGYWLMMFKNIFFILVPFIYYQLSGQLYGQNVLIEIIELIFIVQTKKYFSKKVFPS